MSERPNEEPGCLGVLFGVLLVAILAVIIQWSAITVSEKCLREGGHPIGPVAYCSKVQPEATTP